MVAAKAPIPMGIISANQIGATVKICCNFVNGKTKTAKLRATCKRRISLPPSDLTGRYGISEFLQQPAGLEAMLNTRALQSYQPLDSHTYRCTLQKIQFMSFEVIPVLDLRLSYTTKGCAVELLSCKFEGSEVLMQQNDLFSAFMRNDITWNDNSSEPYLNFDVNLAISLQVYTQPFTMLPTSAVETPGNIIMQGLIDRLVPLLIQQLLEDYRKWAAQKPKLSA